MNKTKRINIRLTEADYKKIIEKQKISGTNLSRYYEEQLCGRNVIVIDGIHSLFKELRHIGTNVNQLIDITPVSTSFFH